MTGLWTWVRWLFAVAAVFGGGALGSFVSAFGTDHPTSGDLAESAFIGTALAAFLVWVAITVVPAGRRKVAAANAIIDAPLDDDPVHGRVVGLDGVVRCGGILLDASRADEQVWPARGKRRAS